MHSPNSASMDNFPRGDSTHVVFFWPFFGSFASNPTSESCHTRTSDPLAETRYPAPTVQSTFAGPVWPLNLPSSISLCHATMSVFNDVRTTSPTVITARIFSFRRGPMYASRKCLHSNTWKPLLTLATTKSASPSVAGASGSSSTTLPIALTGRNSALSRTRRALDAGRPTARGTRRASFRGGGCSPSSCCLATSPCRKASSCRFRN
mmetsp:Transcript_31461/g.90899  ORF Transcript_31461/g.90899 Transcript_31461/m.90899 type:complete len:207 (+) Transcript_31461:2478-3098(+)